MSIPQAPQHGSVERVAALTLAVTEAPWPFALANRAEIERNWQRRVAGNPAFFNGRVFIVRTLERTADGYGGSLSLEAFADFLYWRDLGLAEDATLDGFGSALVRSVEGHVLLARHAADTLNPGSVYLPGGFLDARDVTAAGLIDVDRAIARELAEETGLDAGQLARVPGYLVTRLGRYCSFAVEYRSQLSSADLQSAMRRGLAASAEGELTDIIIVRDARDAGAGDLLDHARLLVETVLGSRS